MRTKITPQKQEVHPLQYKTKAANQASISQLLQASSIENGELKVENGKVNNSQHSTLLQRKILSPEGSLSTFNSQLSTEGQSEFDDELLQGKLLLQRKSLSPEGSLSTFNSQLSIEELSTNKTGLPDNLKAGIENLSGYSMEDVRVHYNSSKPTQLQALAYTQGTDIHVAPGQEKHLAHEAWHVVQQKQGRVKPTIQLQGININDNEGLEKEADVMGGIIQKKNKKNKKKWNEDQLIRNFNSSFNNQSHDDSVDNYGSLGGNLDPYIGNISASRHHIFPKSTLKLFAQFLSKIQQTIQQNRPNSTGSILTFFNQIENRISGYTIGKNRSLELGEYLYWLPGNLFIGVASQYRTDDPGNAPEKSKPKTLDDSQFRLAITWGSNCKELISNNFTKATLEDLATNLESNIEMRNQLKNYELHVTDKNALKEQNYDWTCAENHAWGKSFKIYNLKK